MVDTSKHPEGLARRRIATRKGRWSEILAAWCLRLKGYKIEARNFRAKSGEIDIIARKADLVAVVEVKARQDVETAIDAVTHESQRRIQNAAHYWLSSRRDAHLLSLRFDIIAVVPRRWPVHFEDAF